MNLRDRVAEQDEEEAQAPALPVPAEPAAVRLLTLQRTIGNQRVGRLVERSAARGGAALLLRQAVTPATPATTEQEAIEQAEAFFRAGPYTGTVTPGAGTAHGGFDGSYDPPNGLFTVSMHVGVDFKDGIDDSTGTLVPGDPSMAGVVARANRLTGTDRATFIAQYQWQDAERDQWRGDLEGTIETAWGSSATGHEFHLSNPGWEWIGARVAIDLEVHDAVASGTDHLTVTTIKFPAGQNLYAPLANPQPSETPAGTPDGFSFTDEGDPTNDHDQTMLLASTDLFTRPDGNSLRTEVTFGRDDAALDAGDTGFLDDWIATFNGRTGDRRSIRQTVSIMGHASSSGGETHNQGLSERRVKAVADYIKNHPTTLFSEFDTRVATTAVGERGANPVDSAADRRVEIVVGDGSAQVLAVHEFGHAFGLDDEYADTPLVSGSGAAVGDPASHDAATKAMQDAGGRPLEGAIHETTDSIMSVGNVIRPQHYSMFHKALTEITGQSPWALGPPLPHPGARTPAP